MSDQATDAREACVEAAARAEYEASAESPYWPHEPWEQMDDGIRELYREPQRRTFTLWFAPSRVPCPTCQNNPAVAWCEFDGTAEGCTRVTEFTGGHGSGFVRWKTTTYEGGWVQTPDNDAEEFSPGDTILKRKDGSYSVGSYKAWSQRLVKMLGCPDCSDGTVEGPSLAEQVLGLEQVGWFGVFASVWPGRVLVPTRDDLPGEQTWVPVYRRRSSESAPTGGTP